MNSVFAVCLYQTAEMEQSRRMSAMVVESGCVSMGTGAPLLPQVFVVVNGMRTLVTACSGTLSALLLLLSHPHGFDKVHLVAKTHEPPAVGRQNIFGIQKKKKKNLQMKAHAEIERISAG